MSLVDGILMRCLSVTYQEYTVSYRINSQSPTVVKLSTHFPVSTSFIRPSHTTAVYPQLQQSTRAKSARTMISPGNTTMPSSSW